MMKLKKRCVIVASAPIHNYDFVRSFIDKDDFFIFADGGLRHKDKLSVSADLVVGDFDSYDGDIDKYYESAVIKLPTSKDDTDTFFAAKKGIELGYSSFLLLGVLGSRLDHSLANISALVMLSKSKKNALAVDDYSISRVIVSGERVYITQGCKYFSLISLSEKCDGVNIKNAEYPLNDGFITLDYQYAISNRTCKKGITSVSLKNGIMLVMEIFSDN